MWTVNFLLKNTPNTLTLVFKVFKNAEKAYTEASICLDSRGAAIVEFKDDCGLNLSIDMLEVASITFSEYANDMDKNMDLQIIQHKAQLKAQARAKQDMTLHMLEKQANPIIKAN